MSYQPTTIGCPACGERSDVGMAFCIHCGSSMQPNASAQVSVPTKGGTGAVASGSGAGSEAMTVTCLACGRSDPLNKEFCIFCGAKAATSAVRTSTPNTSGVRMQTQINALEQDIRTQTGEPPQKTPSSVVPGMLGVVAGLSVGALLAFPAKGLLESQVVKGSWPATGLVIYADKPAQVFIKSADERTFTAAATAPNGSLAIGDLQPGKYDVTITSLDGKSLNEKVAIESTHPAVLGYPERLHL